MAVSRFPIPKPSVVVHQIGTAPLSILPVRLLDPTLSSAIPVDAPRRTTTDMLVLQTRPHGVAHSPLSGPVSRLTVGYLAKLNPALVPLLATRSERYDRLSAELAARPGPIIPIHALSTAALAAGAAYNPAWLAPERVISINTAAAGGNAALVSSI